MRKQLNVRLPELTINQINELLRALPAESQAHVVMIAIDRLHSEEKPKGNITVNSHNPR